MSAGNVHVLFPFLSVWTMLQRSMSAVFRWGKYRKVFPTARLQSNTEHTLAFMATATTLIPRLKHFYPRLDGELLLTAILWHDSGEGVLKQDIAYADKSSLQDVREYLAFDHSISDLSPTEVYCLRRAFLLQQVEKSWEGFPPEAVVILNDLRATRRMESRIFRGLEYADYIFFTMEQAEALRDPTMLIWTLRNCATKLDEVSENCYGLRQLVWTQEHSRWAAELLVEYAHIPTEDVLVAQAG